MVKVDGRRERCCGQYPAKRGSGASLTLQSCPRVHRPYCYDPPDALSTLTVPIARVSLYLDPQIRDWVLFPITLVMVGGSHPRVPFTDHNPKIFVGVLRHYVVVLLQSMPKKLSRVALREQCVPLLYFDDLLRKYCVHPGGLSQDPRYSAPRLQSHLYHHYTTIRYLRTFPRHSRLAHISKTVHPKVTQLCPHRIPSRTRLPWTG